MVENSVGDDDAEIDIDKYFATNRDDDPFYNYQLDANNIDLEALDERDGLARPQKEMSREDFDHLFTKRFSEILEDKSFETLFDKSKGQGEPSSGGIREENEEEEDPMTESNMFGNIEQNFPELFGEDLKNGGSSAKSFSQRVTAPMGFAKNVLDQSDISSVEMEAWENGENENGNDADSLNLEEVKRGAMFQSGLNLSLDEEHEDENDFKDIDIKAIKSMKINNSNNFVMDNDEAKHIKKLIMAKKQGGNKNGSDLEARRSWSLNDSLEEEGGKGSETETEGEEARAGLDEAKSGDLGQLAFHYLFAIYFVMKSKARGFFGSFL